jgi:hypothetical protein
MSVRQEATTKHHDTYVISLFPDVCIVPISSPVPFPVCVRLSDAGGTAFSVFLRGKPAFHSRSFVPFVMGHQAGVKGGVSNGAYMGFVMPQGRVVESVIVEKTPMFRCDDLRFWMNSPSPSPTQTGNTIGKAVYQPQPLISCQPSGTLSLGCNPPVEPETPEESWWSDFVDWVDRQVDFIEKDLKKRIDNVIKGLEFAKKTRKFVLGGYRNPWSFFVEAGNFINTISNFSDLETFFKNNPGLRQAINIVGRGFTIAGSAGRSGAFRKPLDIIQTVFTIGGSGLVLVQDALGSLNDPIIGSSTATDINSAAEAAAKTAEQIEKWRQERKKKRKKKKKENDADQGDSDEVAALIDDAYGMAKQIWGPAQLDANSLLRSSRLSSGQDGVAETPQEKASLAEPGWPSLFQESLKDLTRTPSDGRPMVNGLSTRLLLEATRQGDQIFKDELRRSDDDPGLLVSFTDLNPQDPSEQLLDELLSQLSDQQRQAVAVIDRGGTKIARFSQPSPAPPNAPNPDSEFPGDDTCSEVLIIEAPQNGWHTVRGRVRENGTLYSFSGLVVSKQHLDSADDTTDDPDNIFAYTPTAFFNTRSSSRSPLPDERRVARDISSIMDRRWSPLLNRTTKSGKSSKNKVSGIFNSDRGLKNFYSIYAHAVAYVNLAINVVKVLDFVGKLTNLGKISDILGIHEGLKLPKDPYELLGDILSGKWPKENKSKAPPQTPAPLTAPQSFAPPSPGFKVLGGSSPTP